MSGVRILLALGLFAAAGAAWAPSALAASFVGRVISVQHGNQVTVLRDGRQFRVRLHGVDAPEPRQAFGREAGEYLARRAYRETVRVRVTTTERHGYVEGEVFLGRESLNRALVEAGLAWADPQTGARFSELEAEARRRRVGLWSEEDPVPPWEFRRRRER